MSRVYVSSTYSDLRECREKVCAALRKLGHEDVAMEYYAAGPSRPLERCLEDVAACDLYIGIFAWRYGFIPPAQDKSITELEFRKAVAEHKDCLIFLLKEGASWPTDQIEFASYQRMEALRKELSENYVVGFFTGKDDIEARVMESMISWEARRQRTRGPQTKHIPFQAPPLPAHYIERTAAFREVTEPLLRNVTDQNGILVVSALHGLGGIGKTALATAIAHDPLIRERFKDGILWATLGQNPDSLSHLTSWIQALGDKEYRPTTPAAATSYLRTLLYPTASLLIVDDVWASEHAAPFLAGGPNCRLLITTRRAQVADDLGAHLCSIEVMTPGEALDLLRKRVEAGRREGLGSRELEQAGALAQEAGYLPLAIELMGALVARGYDWEDARNALSLEQSRRARGAAHQHWAQFKLQACLQVSLNWLRAENQKAWECFAWLGVLPDDVVLNPRMCAVLWQLSEGEARQLLNSLADDSILQRTSLSFGVHDLMHEMARQLLTSAAPKGLGLTRSQAHGLLLGRYAGQLAGRRWDKLADDGYIHSRLLWHFEQSGDKQAIHELLRLETEDGQHAWYLARDQLGQAAGFIADLAAGWRLVREDINPRLGQQCRYALMLASLHSLAQLIPPRVLGMLVQHGVWTAPKALDHIRRISDLNRRAATLTQIIPTLVKTSEGKPELGTKDLLDTLSEEAKTTIAAGVDGISAAELLGALAEHYTGEEQAKLVDQAIVLVEKSPESLRNLVKSIPQSFRDVVLEKACDSCRQTGDPTKRVMNLAALIPKFSSPQKKTKWIRVLQDWTDELQNTRDTRLEPTKEPGTESAFYRASSSPASNLPIQALTYPIGPANQTVTQESSEEEQDPRTRVVKYCLENGIDLSEDWIRRLSQALGKRDRNLIAGLTRHSSPEAPNEDRAKLGTLERFSKLLETTLLADLDELVSLVPLIPQERDEHVRSLVFGYRQLSSEEQGELLTRVAPFASPECCRKMINELIESGRDSIGGQCLLANMETDPARAQRFDSIIGRLNSVSGAHNRESAMIAIVRVCPISIALRALSSLQRIDDVDEQTGAVFVLAPFLSEGLSPDTSTNLEQKGWNRKQIVTLTRMVSDLSKAIKGGVLEDFVKEAARFSSEWWIVEALTLTILRLHDKERLRAILLATKHITAFDLKARLAGRLALRLARAGYIEEAIEAAESVPLVSDRWIILADLASELAADHLFNEAATVTAKIFNAEERSKANAAIALHLAASGEVERASEIAQALPVTHWRQWIQTRLDLMKNPAELVTLNLPDQSPTSLLSDDANEINLESVCAVAEDLIKDGADCSEIHKVLAASRTSRLEDVRCAAKEFWQAKLREEKTYLEIIAEQPRPLLLKKLQYLAPLLTLSFEKSDAEELVSAIEDVSTWWP